MNRFIKEYANYKIDILTSYSKEYPQNKAIFDEKISNIEKAINYASRDLITVDETIKIINEQ